MSAPQSWRRTVASVSALFTSPVVTSMWYRTVDSTDTGSALAGDATTRADSVAASSGMTTAIIRRLTFLLKRISTSIVDVRSGIQPRHGRDLTHTSRVRIRLRGRCDYMVGRAAATRTVAMLRRHVRKVNLLSH